MAQLELTEWTRNDLFPDLAQASDGPQLAPTSIVPELVIGGYILEVFIGNDSYFIHL